MDYSDTDPEEREFDEEMRRLARLELAGRQPAGAQDKPRQRRGRRGGRGRRKSPRRSPKKSPKRSPARAAASRRAPLVPNQYGYALFSSENDLRDLVDSLLLDENQLSPAQYDHLLRLTLEQLLNYDRKKSALQQSEAIRELNERIYNKLVSIRDLLINRDGYGEESQGYIRVMGSRPLQLKRTD